MKLSVEEESFKLPDIKLIT